MSLKKQVPLEYLQGRLHSILEDVVEGCLPGGLKSHYARIVADTELCDGSTKTEIASIVGHLRQVYGSIVDFSWVDASEPNNIAGLHGFPMVFLVAEDSLPVQSVLTMKGCCSSPNSCILEVV